MTFEFRLPDIGEGIAEGEIVKWHVAVGDEVKEDQTVAEIMTDKVTAEIPSPKAGVVKELCANEGDVIEVGSVFIIFDEAGSGSSASSASKEKEAEKEQNADEEAGNSAVAVKSPPYGKTEEAATLKPPKTQESGSKVKAAPATRKLARQMDIDITQIVGSGVGGRVTQSDVKAFAGNGGAGTAQVSQPAAQTGASKSVTLPQPQPVLSAGEDKRAPFGGMRRTIAEHLTKSKLTAPHFGYVDEVDMTALVQTRKELKDVAAEQGVKLTYLPFIIKAVIAGLKKYPVVNSQLDETTNELVYKGSYNIGIAVATDAGLVVPVIKHADQKSIVELAREVANLSEKARNNKLSLEEIKGGTFTITSIGSIGGLFGIPIINYPEVGIMGVNKITRRPMVDTIDDEEVIVIKDMMNLSLACDHRVVDGAEGAMFMNEVIANLSSPSRLLLN